MRFPIAVHKDEGTIYGVSVPDLPGCFSSGKTFDQAIESAKEAITAHIETLLELGETVDVKATDIEDHIANPEYTGAIWAVIDVDLSELDAAPSRFNVSMPRFVLARLTTTRPHGTRPALVFSRGQRLKPCPGRPRRTDQRSDQLAFGKLTHSTAAALSGLSSSTLTGIEKVMPCSG